MCIIHYYFIINKKFTRKTQLDQENVNITLLLVNTV